MTQARIQNPALTVSTPRPGRSPATTWPASSKRPREPPPDGAPSTADAAEERCQPGDRCFASARAAQQDTDVADQDPPDPTARCCRAAARPAVPGAHHGR